MYCMRISAYLHRIQISICLPIGHRAPPHRNSYVAGDAESVAARACQSPARTRACPHRATQQHSSSFRNTHVRLYVRTQRVWRYHTIGTLAPSELDTLKGMASDPDKPKPRALPRAAQRGRCEKSESCQFLLRPRVECFRERARLMALRCISRGHGRGCRIIQMRMRGGWGKEASERIRIYKFAVPRLTAPSYRSRRANLLNRGPHLISSTPPPCSYSGPLSPLTDVRLQGPPSLDLHYFTHILPHGSTVVSTGVSTSCQQQCRYRDASSLP